MKTAFKLTAVAAGLMLSANAFASNPTPPPTGDVDSGFPAVASFDSSGPFATTSESAGRSCTAYRPRTLGENNLQHPIIVWGNGTGASPRTYRGLLNHWASHGFVVIAANTSNPGSGDEMVACLDYLVSQNARSTGTYSGKLNVNRVGVSGHSQGGGGTIMAGRDSRFTVTAPFQPYVRGLGHRTSSQSNQNGPMFLMTGSSDTLAGPTLNGAPVFRNANVPVFWGNLRGAGHFEPVGDGGDYRGPSTAWYRFHLMGDSNAESMFYGSNCTLCNDRSWEVRTKGIN